MNKCFGDCEFIGKAHDEYVCAAQKNIPHVNIGDVCPILEEDIKHWYVAQNFLTKVLSVEYSEDGSYSKTKPPFSENSWFFTEEEAIDYLRNLRLINTQKELEEKCNEITNENLNKEEWDTNKDITYIINAINNSCYIPKIKFELIEAVIAVARKNKLE